MNYKKLLPILIILIIVLIIGLCVSNNQQNPIVAATDIETFRFGLEDKNLDFFCEDLIVNKPGIIECQQFIFNKGSVFFMVFSENSSSYRDICSKKTMDINNEEKEIESTKNGLVLITDGIDIETHEIVVDVFDKV